ncbi:STAS domain-containing protein [Streptosporangium lutulentum]
MDDTDGATCSPVYDDETLRITSTVHPPGIRLEGELDRSGVPALTAALAGAAHRAAHGDGLLSVDLSGLEFIDVSGLRVLVTAASARVVAVRVSSGWWRPRRWCSVCYGSPAGTRRLDGIQRLPCAWMRRSSTPTNTALSRSPRTTAFS